MTRRYFHTSRFAAGLPYWAYFTRKAKGAPAMRPLDRLRMRLHQSRDLSLMQTDWE